MMKRNDPHNRQRGNRQPLTLAGVTSEPGQTMVTSAQKAAWTGGFLADLDGMTPEALERRRAIASAMMKRNTNPQDAATGAAQGLENVIGALMNKRLDALASPASEHAARQGSRKVANVFAGIPQYRHGTAFHPGGPAIVGEDGPELVQLPRGAQVAPNPRTSVGNRTAQWLAENGRADLARQVEAGQITGADAVRSVTQRPPRELPPQGQNRFNDAASYQTADLDAFKMMQLQPEYGAFAEGDANSTEGENLSLLRRMMFADAALEDPRLAKAMTRMDNNIAGRFGALGRLYTDDEFELGNLMAETFSNAVIRADSGAQAPEPEVRRYKQQFFPLPNETDAQLQAKKALRRETIRAMAQTLANDDAGPLMEQVMAEIEELKRLADVPDGSLTGGAEPLDDADREYLKSLGLE